jgi:hypothetical protein
MNNFRLTISILSICMVTIAGVALTGCYNTRGLLEIKGKVMDDYTGKGIPYRSVIIQGLSDDDEKLTPADAGHFYTDSAGCFTYSLNKIKGAHFYDFCFVGDSDYTYYTRRLSLFDIEQHADELSFYLSKLADLTIKICRVSKKPAFDTLSLTWESNGVTCWSLFTYKIDNFGQANNPYGLTSGKDLWWVGGKVNSTVKTRVYADKVTRLFWDITRDGRKSQIIDTMTIRRGFPNVVYFTY